MSARPVYAGATLLIAAFAAASGCARKSVARIPTPATPVRVGATQTGIASWYGEPYNGRRSSSGEIYDMEQLTAAHRTWPFNTWVEVTDLDNGKRVEVRIIDRGPFVDGRIIDLSLAAARKIDMVGPGTARVKLKVIEQPPAAASSRIPAARYTVQAGVFSDRTRAEAVASSLLDMSLDISKDVRVVHTGRVWRVLVGGRMPADAANQLAAKVRKAVGEAFVVTEP